MHSWWKTQSLTMKRTWIALGILTVVILVHGTYTFRQNYQIAFAQAVERKIDIETIHVRADHGTLVLVGKASKEQSLYAESVAREFIQKYAHRTINPPSDVRNSLEIEMAVTKAAPRANPDRSVANEH